MKNSLLAFCFLLFWDPSLFSQRVISVSYQEDAQGNYVFFGVNRAFCNYILEINFTSLDNAKSDQALPYRAIVRPGSNKLFRLSKENPANPMAFKYTIGSHKGCIDPKVDTGFTYLFPISPGKSAQAYELGNSKRPVAGEMPVKNWYAIRLKMKPGDTIYAARRGTVTEVDVGSNQNDSGATAFSEDYSDNYIEIVHGDCSFAQYGIVKKNGSFVRPGQFVEAGQPIGLVGGDRFGRGAEIRFSVTYNQGDADMYAVYVPLKFWTKKNGKSMLKHGATYTSEFPESIVTQEMSKTELKKRKTGPIPKTTHAAPPSHSIP